jgi:6-pyruvoyltetrahydropterin/6-carboxytetrahydropterin synthase
MSRRVEIVKSFTFEAAHRLAGFPDGHPNTRFHGHSFRVEVALAAAAPGPDGFVARFEDVARALADVRGELDHRLLNEVEGLGQPTLENIALWIAERLSPALPQLSRVSVYRPSCNEACHLTL